MNKKILLLSIAFLLVIFGAKAQIFSEDFESGADDWTFIDNDGDNNNWLETPTGIAGFGDNSIISFSYNNAPLTPDNLAISPQIDLTNTSEIATGLNLSYQYTTQQSYYAEKYSIYVTTSNNPEDILNSTPIYTETVSESQGGIINVNNVDLSDYIGQNIYVTFRHYDTADEYYLILDNIVIEDVFDDDVSLASIDTGDFQEENNSVEITGDIVNKGNDPINSIILNWQIDEGTVNTETISGLEIPAEGSYSFTHQDTWMSEFGNHDLKVWISEVNTQTEFNSYKAEKNKTIYVANGSTTKKPLLERFTSATCGPCASFNANAYNNFHQQRSEDYTYLAYHMNYPDFSSQGGAAGDPYYVEEAGVRHNLYRLSSIPSLIVEGKLFNIYADNVNTWDDVANNLSNSVDEALNRNAYFEISSADATIEDGLVSVDIDILPYINGDFTIFTVVKENTTTGNVLPTNVGGNGETEFIDVMMKMIPNAEGTTVNFTSGNSYQTTLTADLSDTFVENYNDLNVIVFIQHMPTLTVMQSTTATTTLSTENYVANSGIEIYPNPVNNNESLNIQMQDKGTVEIYDLAGRLVINTISLKNGNNEIDINQLSQGIYITKIQTNNKSFTKKIIIN